MSGPVRAGRPRGIVRSVALASAAAALLSAFVLLDKQSAGDWEGKLVAVPKGSRLPDMVSILREGGVLPHPLAFRALVLLTFTSRRLRYGEYAFPRPSSVFETWEKLVRGDVIKYEVTVAPGSNLYDVAALLKEKSLVTPEEFMAASHAVCYAMVLTNTIGKQGGKRVVARGKRRQSFQVKNALFSIVE